MCGDLPSPFVLSKHSRCWIYIHTSLVTQIAKIAVVYEAFTALIKMIENHEEVLGAKLDFQCLQRHHKLIKSYLSISIFVEKAESWADFRESLLYPNVNELHTPSQMYLFRCLLRLFGRCLVFEIRGQDAVDLR